MVEVKYEESETKNAIDALNDYTGYDLDFTSFINFLKNAPSKKEDFLNQYKKEYEKLYIQILNHSNIKTTKEMIKNDKAYFVSVDNILVFDEAMCFIMNLNVTGVRAFEFVCGGLDQDYLQASDSGYISLFPTLINVANETYSENTTYASLKNAISIYDIKKSKDDANRLAEGLYQGRPNVFQNALKILRDNVEEKRNLDLKYEIIKENIKSALELVCKNPDEGLVYNKKTLDEYEITDSKLLNEYKHRSNNISKEEVKWFNDLYKEHQTLRYDVVAREDDIVLDAKTSHERVINSELREHYMKYMVKFDQNQFQRAILDGEKEQSKYINDISKMHKAIIIQKFYFLVTKYELLENSRKKNYRLLKRMFNSNAKEAKEYNSKYKETIFKYFKEQSNRFDEVKTLIYKIDPLAKMKVNAYGNCVVQLVDKSLSYVKTGSLKQSERDALKRISAFHDILYKYLESNKIEQE